jgi:hypothetical protein
VKNGSRLNTYSLYCRRDSAGTYAGEQSVGDGDRAGWGQMMPDATRAEYQVREDEARPIPQEADTMTAVSK